MIDPRRSAPQPRGIGMICSQIIAILLILGAAVPKPAWAEVLSPVDLVKEAVEAQGGVETLPNLKRIAIQGEVRHWEPEESFVAGGPPIFTDRSTFSIIWDLENGMARTDWDRTIRKRAHGHRLQSDTQSESQHLMPQTATPPTASLVGDWGR